MKKDHTGSAFDSFLAEENLLEEAEAVALKRVIAWQLKTAMNTKHVSKTQLAQQLHTSRSQVNRLLDPAYVGVSIGRVAQAARAVGKRFRFEIIEDKPPRTRRKSRARTAAAGA